MRDENTMSLYYQPGCRGNANNTRYPAAMAVTGPDALRAAVRCDHVSACYRDGHRGIKNFIEADAAMFDVDNTPAPGAEDIPPEQWSSPEDIKQAFPGVAHYIVYSRNHMKEKNGLPARPRFHVYFPIGKIASAGEYRALKDAVCDYFPAFDRNARDAARFFFGVDKPQIEIVEGAVDETG